MVGTGKGVTVAKVWILHSELPIYPTSSELLLISYTIISQALTVVYSSCYQRFFFINCIICLHTLCQISH